MRAEPRSVRRAVLLLLACVLPLSARVAAQVSADGDLGPYLIDDRQRTDARAAPPAEVDLQDRLSKLPIAPGPDGLRVTVDTPEGPRELSAEEYVEAVLHAQQNQRSHGWLFVALNITSHAGIAWIALGFLGQALFTFRMVLQWLASEKHKRSVVPVGFWWGSLIGGLMLFVYFVWRKDIVGIVGQSTGVFVYARNLILIYRQKHSALDPIARPAGQN
jgi:lipid-A-disaccharide synthase-like uncharacterized protein